MTNGRREFVTSSFTFRTLAIRPRQCPGQVAAELLAVAQDLVGLDPTRRRGEADGGEQAGDFLDRPRPKSVDHGSIGRPLARTIHAIAEHGPGDGALAAAGGADDQADLPGRRMMSDE